MKVEIGPRLPLVEVVEGRDPLATFVVVCVPTLGVVRVSARTTEELREFFSQLREASDW
jgi:hypothetical protein